MADIKASKSIRACLGLGSNIHPGYNLVKAVEFLRDQIEVVNISNVWETKPVGTKGAYFLNAAVVVQTRLSTRQLKYQVTRPIEIKLGRVRTPDKYAPRTIDIDLLIWDDQIVDNELLEHAYIAVPVSEVLPNFIPTASGETIKTIAQKLNDSKTVVKCQELSFEI